MNELFGKSFYCSTDNGTQPFKILDKVLVSSSTSSYHKYVCQHVQTGDVKLIAPENILSQYR